MKASVVRGIGLAALLSLAGCTMFQSHTFRIDAAVGMYQAATFNYRVDGGQLSEPLSVARIAGQQVTHERMPSIPHADCSVARLTLQYPHPAGKAGYAVAKLVVETRAPLNSASPAKKAVWEQWSDAIVTTARDIVPGIKASDDLYEVWSLDISKNDLDRVIAGLMQSGYFVNPSKPAIGVELSAQVDNFEACKNWTHEPELDILMERVRQQGQLVSYQRPLETGIVTMAVAAGPGGNRATLASRDEQGPALFPAGPQSNTYPTPSQAASPSVAPQYAPAAPNPLRPALPNTPPRVGPYSTPASRLPAATPALPRQFPGVQRRAVSPNGQPAPRSPAVGPRGNRNNAPARSPYPPQNRWPPVPPAAAQNRAVQGDAGKAAGPSGAAQSRFRWPWRRSNGNAGANSGAPSPSNANPPDPRRPWLPRNATQPVPGGGGAPPFYQGAAAPAGNDSSPGAYPAGMPQPPQITSRPSAY